MKLTNKQRVFCHEYIIDFNATRAAKAAGYKEKYAKQMAAENLSKPYLQVYLTKLINNRMESLDIDARYVLNRLIEIDQMDVADIVNDDGSVKAISDWPKVWRTSLSALDIQELTMAEDSDLSSVVKKIKWPDKLKNLELIGKHTEVKAWEKESANVQVANNIMPVPTADSVNDWEAIAQANQDNLLNR